jgi:hypothetical protein
LDALRSGQALDALRPGLAARSLFVEADLDLAAMTRDRELGPEQVNAPVASGDARDEDAGGRGRGYGARARADGNEQGQERDGVAARVGQRTRLLCSRFRSRLAC